MTCFVIKNCALQFLCKNMEWLDVESTDNTSTLFHTPHKDIALNQLIEINTKDITLRAEVICCEQDVKGRPILPQDEAQEKDQQEAAA